MINGREKTLNPESVIQLVISNMEFLYFCYQIAVIVCQSLAKVASLTFGFLALSGPVFTTEFLALNS